MLVLGRRQGERIVIDDHIVVTILQVKGNKTRVGVEAPHNVRVLRQEIYDAFHPVDPIDPIDPGQA